MPEKIIMGFEGNDLVAIHLNLIWLTNSNKQLQSNEYLME